MVLELLPGSLKGEAPEKPKKPVYGKKKKRDTTTQKPQAETATAQDGAADAGGGGGKNGGCSHLTVCAVREYIRQLSLCWLNGCGIDAAMASIQMLIRMALKSMVEMMMTGRTLWSRTLQ